jgi:carbonic anhydrase/acetyltransferase-like protein (isoleucine patch superfamily)
VGSDSIIAAGTLVPERTVIPPRSLVMGTPGKVTRALQEVELALILEGAANYVRYRRDYMEQDT